MMLFALPILLSLATVSKAYYPLPFYSAASDAQIRFALENKYDDTGPGAKEPEYAYNTYKTLEEALLGYLDDPDTKLPDHERDRAISSLNKPGYIGEYKPYENKGFKRYYPKSVEEYTGYTPQKQQEQGLEVMSKPKPIEVYKGYRLPPSQLVLTKLRTNPPKKYQYQSRLHHNSGFLKQLEEDKEVAEPYRIEKIKQPLREISHGLNHFNNYRDSDLQNANEQFDTHPKYTFSYGVHVPDTGDMKSAQESREGGTVRGYYSFVDPDGKLRTVHYKADDKSGFQATVERQ